MICLLFFVLAVIVFCVCYKGGAPAEAIYGVIGFITVVVILAMLAASC